MGVKILIGVFMFMLLAISAFSGILVGRLCDKNQEAFIAAVFTFTFMLATFLLYNAGMVYTTL